MKQSNPRFDKYTTESEAVHALVNAGFIHKKDALWKDEQGNRCFLHRLYNKRYEDGKIITFGCGAIVSYE